MALERDAAGERAILETCPGDRNSSRPPLGVRALAAAFVVVWIITGPIFGFTDTWQLVMNTVSSIVTFLMAFLIQNAQNRDSAALQLKLDELIKASNSPRQDVIGIEDKPESELKSKRKELASQQRS